MINELCSFQSPGWMVSSNGRKMPKFGWMLFLDSKFLKRINWAAHVIYMKNSQKNLFQDVAVLKKKIQGLPTAIINQLQDLCLDGSPKSPRIKNGQN
jgi:hypothetical protein